MLCRAEQSQLLLIDIQQRLAQAMDEALGPRAIHNSGVLSQAAALLEVPQLVTRQYPRGLGELVPALAAQLPAGQPLLDKTSFSCCASPGFMQTLDAQRPQVVIAGMESHVCVLQTALELQQQGRRVFVVEDALCSRQPLNHHNALARMRAAGIIITNTESVLFEWLRDAGHARFKTLSQLIR